MSVTFHILDALSRDQYSEVTRETEEEQEIQYSWDDTADPDISYGKADSSKRTCMMTIHLFGMTASGESLRCDVEGFRPFLYVKVPPSLDIMQFRSQLGQDAPASMSVERIKRKELYGFTADEEFTFFKLSVANMKDFRAVKNLLLNDHQEPIFTLSKKSAPLPIYESGLDPLLRFFHLRDVAPCGWVTVDPEDDSNDEETGIRVITCQWEAVSPEPKPPKPAAPFKTLFWDLECYSKSGDFPVAKPDRGSGDPIIQIGCVLKDSDGSIQKTIFVLNTCDDIDGAEVKHYSTEQEMLLAWFDWLIETNPDVWVGYNIFGFDERYLWQRAEVLRLTDNTDLQKMSRLFGHGGRVNLQEKRLASSAMGDNFLHTLSLQGRLRLTCSMW
jgi:DNA polymerase delta subunit 1